MSPSDTEVTVQFYQPTLEENDPQKPEAFGSEARILLLFALYKKTGPVNQPGVQRVSLSQLNDLHDRLAVLAQKAEISLQEKKKKEPVTASPTPTTKAKKAQRIKALSPKVERDERLENLLRQCVDDVSGLLGIVQEQQTSETAQPDIEQPQTTQMAAPPTTQPEIGASTIVIPFEVTKKNINSFENLFDPSFGFTLQGTEMAQWLLKLLQPSAVL